jgi:hypothetical protein
LSLKQVSNKREGHNHDLTRHCDGVESGRADLDAEDLDFFAIPTGRWTSGSSSSAICWSRWISQGLQVVAFQGASEWALDSLVTTDAVWLREDQLRLALEAALLASGRPELRLACSLNGYRCEMLHEWPAGGLRARDPSEAMRLPCSIC